MKFMIFIHGDEKAMNAGKPDDSASMSPAYAAYNEAMLKAGIMLGGERLRPTDTGRSLRVRDGRTQLVDGPYADSKEQLGGFYMIDVPDLDTAMQWAARCPAAERGTIEVRPIWPTRPE